MRASYGLTGNIDKSTGPDIVAEAVSDGSIPSLNYLMVTNPANPQLGWEKHTIGIWALITGCSITGFPEALISITACQKACWRTWI